MENISHFLRACEAEPLGLPAHDRFLTVDLYEGKDPAQVLQCLGSFSRRANAIRPEVFKTVIGPRKGGGTMSPTSTGAGAGGVTNGSGNWRPASSYGRSASPTKASAALPNSSGTRAMSPALTGGSTGSQKTDGGTKSPSGPVSSWSKKQDEGTTAPAWNIHQYGYMGGASQGNQGISFGARRQITSAGPTVPSLAEKEKRRKEKAAEEDRLRREQEESEERRRLEQQEEEQRAREDEERRWEEETRRQRDEERRRMEDQKRQWAEQERRWKEEEEARRKEDEALKLKSKFPPEKPRTPSSGILRGQTLSQYQKEQASMPAKDDETPEQKRVRELEKQLEEARERERQYQAEREERLRRGQGSGSRPSTAQTQSTERDRPPSEPSEVSWTSDERDYLRSQWQKNHDDAPAKREPSHAGAQQQQRPLPSQPPQLPSRSLPQPEPEPEPEDEEEQPPPTLPQRAQFSTSASSLLSAKNSNSAPGSSPLGTPNRPLPTPNKEYSAYNPIAPAPGPRISSTTETGDTALEQSRDRDTRISSQSTTRAGGQAAKSLLEREMEHERERQKEWEKNQAELKDKPRDAKEGVGEGQSWDVNQYGFMGGDSQNRGSGVGSGIAFGGRRQILGPREMKR